MPERDVLPIPDRPYTGPVYEDAKDPNATFPPIEPLRPPAGAPNVVIVLIDDVGFSASSAFGGPCSTPTAERLAGKRPQVQPLPHDGALLADAGRRSSRAATTTRSGMGGITEIATSAPGYNSIRPNTCAPLAETLKLNGYCDRTVRQVPRGAGLGDEPAGPVPLLADVARRVRALLRLHRRRDEPVRARRSIATTAPIEQPKTVEEGYHFTEDMTDQAIDWIKQQKALMADKPFFVYYAPGATHAPHHVPSEWSDKYKGAFDEGWDALRERDVRPPEGARRRSRPTPSSPNDPPRSPPGTRCPTT